MALNGFAAPAMVFPALTRLPGLTKSGLLFETVNTTSHPNASIACALAIGYMTFDLGAMLVGWRTSIKANGWLTYQLYIWHHLLSILFWPVAVLCGSFTFFVNWFVLSEMSSPWLGMRGAMLSLGTINTPLGLVVQLLFVLTFVLGRIVVMPDLIKAFVWADWEAVPAWQARIAKTTVPIPFLLNAYWGVLGTINTPLGLVVQLLFVLTFVLGRIVVMPDLIKAFVWADWEAVPAWQARIAKTTVPIPFLLNAYWGVMIALSVYKVVFSPKKKKNM